MFLHGLWWYCFNMIQRLKSSELICVILKGIKAIISPRLQQNEWFLRKIMFSPLLHIDAKISVLIHFKYGKTLLRILFLVNAQTTSNVVFVHRRMPMHSGRQYLILSSVWFQIIHANLFLGHSNLWFFKLSDDTAIFGCHQSSLEQYFLHQGTRKCWKKLPSKIMKFKHYFLNLKIGKCILFDELWKYIFIYT